MNSMAATPTPTPCSRSEICSTRGHAEQLNRMAPTVVRIRVGGRLAACRRVGFRHAFDARLARWTHRVSRRGETVMVTIRRAR
jgi:hypothetical protein